MPYCTPLDVVEYLGLQPTDNDLALLEKLAARAQAWIDTYTRRTFEAAADAIHYFEVGRDAVGRALYLDADLYAVTAIKTNLDNGSGGELLLAADYVLEPRNHPPYYEIELRISSAKAWRYTTDPVNAISVEGRWSYSLAAPADIAHACVRLAGYLFRQKDSQVFDTTALPDAGVMTIPQGIPKDVKLILDKYVRASL